MNKLRIIKIYEIKGVKHPMERYIIDLLYGIRKLKVLNFIIYEKRNIIYIRQIFGTSIFILDDKLLTNFGDRFSCNTNEINDIFKYLLNKHLKVKVNILKKYHF